MKTIKKETFNKEDKTCYDRGLEQRHGKPQKIESGRFQGGS
jgi:hypothetical protein